LDSINYSTHHLWIKALYEDKEMTVSAKTHAPRRFGAQQLERRGLPQEKIARIGHWENAEIQTTYLARYSPDMVLAMGDWPGVAQQNLGTYFHDRFFMGLSAELLHKIYPFLPKLKADIDRLVAAKKSTSSANSVYEALLMLGTAVFQDALEIFSTQDPLLQNRCLMKLMQEPMFVDKLTEYKELKKSGVFHINRPASLQEQVASMNARLEGLVAAIYSIGRPLPQAKAAAEEHMRAIIKQLQGPGVGAEADAIPTATEEEFQKGADEQFEDLFGKDSGQEGDVGGETGPSTSNPALVPRDVHRRDEELIPGSLIISPAKKRSAEAVACLPASPLALPLAPPAATTTSELYKQADGLDILVVSNDQNSRAIAEAAALVAASAEMPQPPLQRYSDYTLAAAGHFAGGIALNAEAVPSSAAAIVAAAAPAEMPHPTLQRYSDNALALRASDSTATAPPGALQLALTAAAGHFAGGRALTAEAGPGTTVGIPQRFPAPFAQGGMVPIEMLQQVLNFASGNAAFAGGLHVHDIARQRGTGGIGPLGDAAPRRPAAAASDSEKLIPDFSKFASIKHVMQWLHQPPLGEEGLSIIQREWRFQEAGLDMPDIGWRKDNANARRRICDLKRVYEKVQAVKQENNSRRRIAGGALTDFDVAEMLDAERQAADLKVASWIKRQAHIVAQRRPKQAESEEVADAAPEEGSGMS
jgi:hypothetical protein